MDEAWSSPGQTCRLPPSLNTDKGCGFKSSFPNDCPPAMPAKRTPPQASAGTFAQSLWRKKGMAIGQSCGPGKDGWSEVLLKRTASSHPQQVITAELKGQEHDLQRVPPA